MSNYNYPMIRKPGQTYFIGVDYHNDPIMTVCVMTKKSNNEMVVQYINQFKTTDYNTELEKIKEFYKDCHILKEV